MKKINIAFALFLAVVMVFTSCQPDEHELGDPLDSSDLKYTVTQESGYDNKVFLSSQTTGVIPFWDYSTGTSNKEVDTVTYPFAGDYWIKFSALGRAGATTDSVKITVSKNDPDYFSAPEWNYLTDGVEGKTWVFDLTAPIGYYGSEYIAHTGNSANDWSYFPTDCPDWTGFVCGTNWGEMTFNLDGNFNYSVSQVPLKGGTPTTAKGTFTYDIGSKSLKINNASLLFPGNYNDISSWSAAYVFEIAEDHLYLTLIRASDGAFVVFKYIPKS